MPFLRTTAAAARLRLRPSTSNNIGPVTLAYQLRVQASNLRFDPEQLSLCSKLDALYSSFTTSPKVMSDHFRTIPDEHLEAAATYYSGATSSKSGMLSSWSSSTANNHGTSSLAFLTAHSLLSSSILFPRRKQASGIYIHGSVGVGKSMLMDLFHSICTNGLSDNEEHHHEHANNNEHKFKKYSPINLQCQRYHFHEFMIQIHQKIHTYKSLHPKSDPIPSITAQIAREARILCFDEMQITDIADAMIIKRILTLLLDLGVVVVTTSNRPPSGLYEGGMNRAVFLPLVDVLRERLMVVEMGQELDYRKEKKGLIMESSCNEDGSAMKLPSYLVTSNSEMNDMEVLNEWFTRGGGTERQETLPVAMGRTIHVNKSNDSCAWFSFGELCHQPLGAADYIAIAKRFDTVIVEDVPQMSGHCYNEARRFVVFIDALYEAKTKLIIAAHVPRDDLFLGFDATVETNDGDEEIAVADASGDTYVVGEGGSSSSSSTTMIRTNNDRTVEWSATGRIGVSLAQLSAVKEVSFSFQRAESRIAEMTV